LLTAQNVAGCLSDADASTQAL